mgnify:CR=1 FL=1
MGRFYRLMGIATEYAIPYAWPLWWQLRNKKGIIHAHNDI